MEVDEERIGNAAEELDKAIEKRDVESFLDLFSDDCEIEILGMKLEGKKGARKWIE
ncbi:MAG: nuclear transport factor 2 family protein [Thermoplasmatota archaeon]